MPKAPDVDITKELAAAGKALAPAVKRLNTALRSLNPAKLPAGALADLLYDLRALGKQLGTLSAPFTDALEPRVKEIEEHFVQTLAVGESSGIQGHAARVQVTESVIPTVDDWEKVYAYIKKNNAFELLGRSLKRDAVVERWDAKKQIPGVGKFIAKRVSCTKLGGKGK